MIRTTRRLLTNAYIKKVNQGRNVTLSNLMALVNKKITEIAENKNSNKNKILIASVKKYIEKHAGTNTEDYRTLDLSGLTKSLKLRKETNSIYDSGNDDFKDFKKILVNLIGEGVEVKSNNIPDPTTRAMLVHYIDMKLVTCVLEKNVAKIERTKTFLDLKNHLDKDTSIRPNLHASDKILEHSLTENASELQEQVNDHTKNESLKLNNLKASEDFKRVQKAINLVDSSPDENNLEALFTETEDYKKKTLKIKKLLDLTKSFIALHDSTLKMKTFLDKKDEEQQTKNSMFWYRLLLLNAHQDTTQSSAQTHILTILLLKDNLQSAAKTYQLIANTSTEEESGSGQKNQYTETLEKLNGIFLEIKDSLLNDQASLKKSDSLKHYNKEVIELILKVDEVKKVTEALQREGVTLKAGENEVIDNFVKMITEEVFIAQPPTQEEGGQATTLHVFNEPDVSLELEGADLDRVNTFTNPDNITNFNSFFEKIIKASKEVEGACSQFTAVNGHK
jgi:hypothetical protein